VSIFSGWNRENLRLLWDTATGSPAGLAIFAGIALIMVLAVLVVGIYVSHKIGGFFIKIQQEEEEARREEEAELQQAAAQGTEPPADHDHSSGAERRETHPTKEGAA